MFQFGTWLCLYKKNREAIATNQIFYLLEDTIFIDRVKKSNPLVLKKMLQFDNRNTFWKVVSLIWEREREKMSNSIMLRLLTE